MISRMSTTAARRASSILSRNVQILAATNNSIYASGNYGCSLVSGPVNSRSFFAATSAMMPEKTGEMSDSNEMPCCTKTAWGKLVEKEASPTVGEDITVGGDMKVPAYISSSPVDSDKGIILFPDIWGITNRVRATADIFAAEGYHVLVVDSFYGDTIDKTPDLVEFISKYPYDKISNEIAAAITHLSENGVNKEKIAAIGFCWGAWAILKSHVEGIQWKCAVSPHPSTKVESFIFKRSEMELFEKCTMPFLIMPAGDDDDSLKSPDGEAAKMVEEKGGKSIPFPRMVHGWTSRGDLSIADVKEDAEKALSLATEFVKENNP